MTDKDWRVKDCAIQRRVQFLWIFHRWQTYKVYNYRHAAEVALFHIIGSYNFKSVWTKIIYQ